MFERWLPVIGYEHCYEVSDKGRVRSMDKLLWSKTRGSYMKHGRVLKEQTTHDGYKVVHLCDKGKEVRRRVHVLVLEAFVGQKRFAEYECNHRDGVKGNNSLENLEWCTPRENKQHALAMGLATTKHLVKYRKGQIPWNKGKRKVSALLAAHKELYPSEETLSPSNHD